MQELTEQVRSEPGIEGEQVMLPGDKEIRETDRRVKHGIPLDDHTGKALQELGVKFNVPISFFDGHILIEQKEQVYVGKD